jgi:hypothetical protein
MNPFFAEFVPDANFLLQSVGTLGFVLVIIDRALSISNRNKSQKREVAFETVYATKGELAELKESAERQISDLRDTLQRMEDAAAERRKSIYTKIEQSAKETGATVNTLRLEIKEDIGGVHERVDELVKGVAEIVGQLKRR